jgi:hypothetical protein
MSHKEQIAVIGGGLGGCLTALMLAKEGKYHVTIIEKDKLFNGTPLLASRLHLGGEYPLDSQTASDCLRGGIMWKMLMPKKIYTPTPPMKFLLGEKTQQNGVNYPTDEKTLTLEKYRISFEAIRREYEEKNFHRIQKAFGWNDARAEKELFGSPAEGTFYREFSPTKNKEEFEQVVELFSNPDRGKRKPDQKMQIAGGFQSQELGLNIPKYLAMLQAELEKQERDGNITILTGQKVCKNGIEGALGNFSIQTSDGEKLKDGKGHDLQFDQVIQAAWQGGPEISPHVKQGIKGRDNGMMVHKRAMLLVRLPEGWKTPPAFVMLGSDGGMLSPYNNKIAVCYLPTARAAYVRSQLLTQKNSKLPDDWNHVPDLEDRKKDYFNDLKERFPVLEGAMPLRLVMRDTISFDEALEQRRNPMVIETIGPTSMSMSTQLGMQLQMEQSEKSSLPVEFKKGLFDLCPTKATYAVDVALQAAYMVGMRSQHPEAELIPPPEDPLSIILSEEKRKHYSLADIKAPTPQFMVRFLREHPELEPDIIKDTWPEKQVDLLTEKTRKKTDRGQGRSHGGS